MPTLAVILGHLEWDRSSWFSENSFAILSEATHNTDVKTTGSRDGQT